MILLMWIIRIIAAIIIIAGVVEIIDRWMAYRLNRRMIEIKRRKIDE